MRGGCSLREVLSRDAWEWEILKAFDRISPVGDERLERQIAVGACVSINQYRDKGDACTPDDVIPDHGGARAELEAERLQDKAYRARLLREEVERWRRRSAP